MRPLRRGSSMAVNAMAAVAALTALLGAAPAGAGPDVRLDWCGPVPEAIVLPPLMPGERVDIPLELCNTSEASVTPGLWAVSLGTPPPPLLVDVKGGSITGVSDTPGRLLDGAVLGPGERRTYEVGVTMDPAADNRHANRNLAIDLLLVINGRPAPPVGEEIGRRPEGAGPERLEPVDGGRPSDRADATPPRGEAVLSDSRSPDLRLPVTSAPSSAAPRDGRPPPGVLPIELPRTGGVVAMLSLGVALASAGVALRTTQRGRR